MRTVFFFMVLIMVSSAQAGEFVSCPLDNSNVVWLEPSKGSSGSMPLGNGDIGLNVWVEKDGDLRFYISKTDSFSGLGRILKIGGIRIKYEPNPFAKTVEFKQTLRLMQGLVEISSSNASITIQTRIWIDANNPVIHVESHGNKEFKMKLLLEVWRKKPRELKGAETHTARGIAGGTVKLIVQPDTILPPDKNRIAWYHWNKKSIWPVTMKHQGAEKLLSKFADPLADRIFGGAIKGKGFKAATDEELVSDKARSDQSVSIYILTSHPAKPVEWSERLEEIINRVDRIDLRDAFSAHCRWWSDFWNRSWINVTGSKRTTGLKKIKKNKLPLRIGADLDGGSRFIGDIASVQIFDHALTASEISDLSVSGRSLKSLKSSPVASWNFEKEQDGIFKSNKDEGLSARISGKIKEIPVAGEKADLLLSKGAGDRAICLNGDGYIEVSHNPRLNLENGCTLAAWIRPGKMSGAGGRIINKISVGKDDGYLLDTYPGNSLRMIVPSGTLIYKANLVVGKWVHVVGTYTAKSGVMYLYINGKMVKSSKDSDLRGENKIVSQGYALQRFINACGGRGGLPIKFNGSIFTVDDLGFDPDYRRWGGMYWWQNTRLPYWTMAAAGDFDLMQPLFRMYLKDLPLRKEITKLYYQHGGAFYPETMYFFGMPGNCDYSWHRGNQPVSLMLNRYIRRLWEGGIELTFMMLDYYDYTEDNNFLSKTLLPFAQEITLFYDKHYKRDKNGKLYIYPGQALETWQDAVNPMPEIAGLQRVLGRLLSLPEKYVTSGQRSGWRQLLDSVPDLPTGEHDGKKVLLPAWKFGKLGNIENPELYAIFPYRIFGIGKPGLELARRSFALRRVKGSRGWQQDPIQAALLGLEEQAADFVVNRFATKYAGSRFPAFWGPNFDWVPDQDHGSNGLMGLQAMLLQCEGRRMILFPAWPEGWDVDFKLHAPMKTTVEGIYRDGKLLTIKVIPEGRKKDLEIMKPQGGI